MAAMCSMALLMSARTIEIGELIGKKFHALLVKG
jgi:hypothetical protein